MFPTMEEEVIEAVLRANNGIVDATVDQLLTMSVDIRDCLKEGDDCDNVEDNDLIDTKSVINNLALNQLKSINGVKLKPSHKLDANCCDMLQVSKLMRICTSNNKQIKLFQLNIKICFY